MTNLSTRRLWVWLLALLGASTLLTAPPTAQAQVSDYSMTVSQRAFVPLVYDSIVTNSTDDGTFTVPIKFAFTLNEVTYTDMRINGNGFVVLGRTTPVGGGTNNAYQTGSIPNGRVLASQPNFNRPALSVFGMDLRNNLNAISPIGIRWNLGTPGQRNVVVEYNRYRRFQASFNGDTMTFQIALFENGRIEYRYGKIELVEPTGTFQGRTFGAHVGIRGQAGSDDVLALTGNWAAPRLTTNPRDSLIASNTSFPASGTVYTFAPPVRQPIDAAVTGLDLRLIESGSLLNCPFPAPVRFGVLVTNRGLTRISQATVAYRLDQGTWRTRNVTLNPSLDTLLTDTVYFDGADGISVTQGGNPVLQAAVTVANDGRRRNDTLRRQLVLRGPTPVILNTPITNLTVARQQGWRQGSGTIAGPTPDSINFYRSSFTLGGGTVTGTALTTNIITDGEWFYKPSMLTGGLPLTLRFKLAFTAGTFGTLRPPAINDTLRIMYTTNCGAQWIQLDKFSNRDLRQTRRVDSTLREFSYRIPGGSQLLSIGFFWDNRATAPTETYRFHLDDIALIGDVDLRAEQVRVPRARFFGCPLTATETVVLNVTNNGLNPVSTFTAGIRAGNGPVRTQTVTLPTPLQPGQRRQVTFSGATGLDLTVARPVMILGFATAAGDASPFNDTTRFQLNPQPTRAIPGDPIATSLPIARGQGWRVASGRPIELDTALNIRAYFPGGTQSPVIGFLSDTGQPGKEIRQWLYRPGLQVRSETFLRYKAAIFSGVAGSAAPTTLRQDSLVVLISRDCGQTWQTLQVFTDENRQGGTIDNTYRTFTHSLGATPGVVQVAFYFTNNRTPAADLASRHRFILDDLEFVAAVDASLESAALAGTRFFGCALTTSETVDLVVNNAGITPLTQITVQSIVNGAVSAPVQLTLTPPLPAGQSRSVSLTGANGLNLSVVQPYQIAIIATATTGDATPLNDTVRFTVNPGTQTLTPAPTGQTATTLTQARQQGWVTASGLPLGSTTRVWGDAFYPGNTAISAIIDATPVPGGQWIYRPGLQQTGEAFLRLQVGVFSGLSGNAAVPINPGIGDDTLVIKISRNCGRIWQNLARFTQADLVSGNLSNTLRTISLSLGTQTGPLQVAIVAVDNGTPTTAPYRFIIDDLAILANTDAAVTDFRPVGLNFYGCGPNTAVDTRITFVNQGIQPLSSISIGYQVQGGPLRQRTLTLTPPLAPGESRQETFTGPLAADLSNGQRFVVRAFASALPVDGNKSNDTATTEFVPPSVVTLPGPLPVDNFARGAAQGWRSVVYNQNRQLIGDSSNNWRSLTVTGAIGQVISFLRADSIARQTHLYYRSGYQTSGSLTMRFKLGLLNSTLGTNSVASIGQDTLELVASTDCGRTFRVIRRFVNADIQGLQPTNQMRTFSAEAATGPGPLTIGFRVKVGTVSAGLSGFYRWLIDDIELGNSTDVALSRVFIPDGTTFSNLICPNGQTPITVEVNNLSIGTVPEITVGYIMPNGQITRQTFIVNLPTLRRDTLTLDVTNLPNVQSGDRLRVFIEVAGEEANTRVNDTIAVVVPARQQRNLPTGVAFTMPIMQAQGYQVFYQRRGRAAVPTTPAGQFNLARTFGSNVTTIASTLDSAARGFERWIISPYYQSTIGVRVNFRAAITGNTITTAPYTGELGDDRMGMWYRIGCGPWQQGVVFNQASLTNRVIDNTLRDFTFAINTTEPVQIAYRHDAGVLNDSADSYVWHLTRTEVVDQFVSVRRTLTDGPLVLSPNPARETVQVQLPGQTPATVEVVDVQGRIVLVAQSVGGRASLPVGSLPRGLYIVRVTGQAATPRRLILE